MGALFLTASFIGGAKDWTFSLYLSSLVEHGDGVNGIGQGTYESTGKNRWQLCENGAAHSSQNFALSEFSAPRFEHRILVPPRLERLRTVAMLVDARV